MKFFKFIEVNYNYNTKYMQMYEINKNKLECSNDNSHEYQVYQL